MDSPAGSVPWLIRLRSGLPVTVGSKNHRVEIHEEPAGELDVLSGTLRIGSRHGLGRGSRPLDASVPVGTWQVTRLIERNESNLFDEGDLGVLFTSPGPGVDDLVWEEATSGGFPQRADEVVVDGAIDLALGPTEGARNFPMVYAMSTQEADEYRTFDRSANPGRLTPWAEVRAYKSAPAVTGHDVVRWADSRVWLGRNQRGEVEAVFVDWLAMALGASVMPIIPNPWNDPIEGAQGAEISSDADLTEEPADVNALFVQGDVRPVMLVGESNLSGRLFLAPERPAWHENPHEVVLTEGAQALPLQNSGRVRVYAYRDVDAYGYVTLLRFGNVEPVRWAVLQAPPVRRPVLVSEELLERAPSDEKLRRAYADVSERGYTNTVDDPHAVNWWPTTDGGAPSYWLLGIDQSGRAQAMVVVDAADTSIYTVRDPGLDGNLLRDLRAANVAEEDFAEDMQMLEEGLTEAGGRMTPAVRGHMHWMTERYLSLQP